jgi:hypothetical protein
MLGPLPIVDRVETPFSGHALELVLTPVCELHSGAGDKVPHRRRHEHLPGLGERGNAGAGRNRDSAQLAVDALAFPSVQSGADLEAELPQRLADRTCALDGPSRAVEGGEEPVADGVELLAPEAHELTAHDRVVAP